MVIAATVAAALAWTRNHTTGVATGGLFYELAGRDAQNYTAAERYRPRRRVWERLPEVPGLSASPTIEFVDVPAR
jgi:hypothetical protein